jgi:hypothetical protein
MEENNKEWYSNKELFEMFQDLKEELAITREAVKRYNNIRTDLNAVMQRLTAIEERAIGRYGIGKAVREWGGWLVGLLGFLFALYKAV